jgi:peptidoglycan/xylan/chitin deacetylase (PgdA/CDA1 family)
MNYTKYLLLLCFALTACSVDDSPKELPEKIVALTFDDSPLSHATFVGPLLKELGFGATFFITEGFSFKTDKKKYMTWEQIKALHDQGFEIGNHTKDHKPVTSRNKEQLRADLKHIEDLCLKHGISKPMSFCYPSYLANKRAVEVLKEMGYLYARTGGDRPFNLAKDNPLLMPHVFDSKPNTNFKLFKAALAKRKKGSILVMTFHGVPDLEHKWVNTEPETFTTYMRHLKAEGYTVIALRDISNYKK